MNAAPFEKLAKPSSKRLVASFRSHCDFDGASAMESVWDYPRPPRLEAVPERLEVIFGGRSIVITVTVH
jgi:hypothetical protein